MKAGWTQKPLGDVVTLHYGKPLSRDERSEEGKYPVFGANGVKAYSNKFLSEGPSIIVGRKGSAGEINLAAEPFWPLDVTYFTEHKSDQIDFGFLHFWLAFLNLPTLAKGVKPGINRNEVYALEIPVPPLEEQKRIVAILDEAFAGLDRARAHTEANLQNARDLFESGLDAAFNSESSNWSTSDLSELCEIGDGNHSSKYPKKSEMVDAGVPFLRSTNIQDGEVNQNNVLFITPEKHEQIKKGHLKTGDILFTNRGEIGKVAIVPPELNNSNLNSQVAWLRCGDELSNVFLYYYLQSGKMVRHYQITQSGAALQQFPIKMLKAIRVNYPDFDSQRSLATRLQLQAKHTADLSEKYQSKLTDLDDLRQSLLQKAFAGELT